MSHHVLVVEDDDQLRAQLDRALRGRGYTVTAVGSVAEALRLPKEARWRSAVVDLRLPDGTGLDVLRQLLEEKPKARAVMLTAYGNIPSALKAGRLGAVDFLTKPADVDQILAALEPEDAMPKSAPDLSPPSLQRVEWEHIQRVLHDCGGNVSRAARVLGVHRRTLQRKLSYRPPRR